MDPKDIANKARKVIKLNKDDYVLNKMYFNPAFVQDLYRQVPELEKAGITVSVTETETKDGTLITAAISSENSKMNLGSVLLDGEGIVVKNSLSTIDKLVKFIQVESKVEAPKEPKSD